MQGTVLDFTLRRYKDFAVVNRPRLSGFCAAPWLRTREGPTSDGVGATELGVVEVAILRKKQQFLQH